MKRKRQTISIIFLALAATGSPAQSVAGMPSAVVLEIRRGFTEQGSITPEWKEAIRDRQSEDSLNVVERNKRPVSADESGWLSPIEEKVQSWRGMIDSLRFPFVDLSPPDTLTILLGNQGGSDAFSPSATTICFDLSQLTEYGGASSSLNSERIDRFFAHEFTHVLHNLWAANHALQLRTSLDLALWSCLKEGLGNYRSLSDKWVSEKGKLTDVEASVASSSGSVPRGA